MVMVIKAAPVPVRRTEVIDHYSFPVPVRLTNFHEPWFRHCDLFWSCSPPKLHWRAVFAVQERQSHLLALRAYKERYTI
jgi:hypothetical protein